MPDLSFSRSAHDAESADPSKCNSRTLGRGGVVQRYVPAFGARRLDRRSADLCAPATAPRGLLLAHGLRAFLGSAPNGMKRKGRLVAQRRQVEVDALATHQSIRQTC